MEEKVAETQLSAGPSDDVGDQGKTTVVPHEMLLTKACFRSHVGDTLHRPAFWCRRSRRETARASIVLGYFLSFFAANTEAGVDTLQGHFGPHADRSLAGIPQLFEKFVSPEGVAFFETC